MSFEAWFNGAPVLHTGASGDFAAWHQGAPVLQLQLVATVEIVGSGGVEVGGAADIAVVVHGPVELEVGGGISIARPRRTPKKRRQVVVVGAGGVEVGGAAAVEIADWGSSPLTVRRREAKTPPQGWTPAQLARALEEDEALLLMDVL